MTYLLTALGLITLLAGSVTIVDAARAPHWRAVAVERRQAWRDRAGAVDETDPDHDDHADDSRFETEPLSYAG